MADMADRSAFGQTEPRAHAPAPRATRARTVIVVMVAFKWDLERCAREAMAIKRGLYGYPLHAAMHSKRQIAYIVEIDLTAAEVIERLREPLQAGCVERAWAFTPGADVAANEPLDAFTEKVAEAWRNVRRFNASRAYRRLPSSLFERTTPMDGDRGEVTTLILDEHPLRRGRAQVGAST